MGKPFSIKKRIKSFAYAWEGIKSLARSEHNVWIHCTVAILVIGFGIGIGITKEEWIAVVFCIGMVLVAEAFNTAVEQLVDMVSPHRHPAAGKVKDIAAGAVLIAAITAAVCGLIVFIPYII